MKVNEAITELKKEEKKFDQTVDLIINLRGIDVKRDSINAVFNVPHQVKKKKVCGFLSKKSGVVDTIMLPDFERYKDKKSLKNLVKKYDFFIAHAPLMPKVATTFGKVLGPAGKMPSPQLGIIPVESDDAVKDVLKKIDSSVKIRVKEASIKIPAGKSSMSEKEISENVEAIYHSVIQALPKKQENVKNVMVKLTMSKPLKVDIK
jgi:large subunit ribosomal protein L1